VWGRDTGTGGGRTREGRTTAKRLGLQKRRWGARADGGSDLSSPSLGALKVLNQGGSVTATIGNHGSKHYEGRGKEEECWWRGTKRRGNKRKKKEWSISSKLVSGGKTSSLPITGKKKGGNRPNRDGEREGGLNSRDQNGGYQKALRENKRL